MTARFTVAPPTNFMLQKSCGNAADVMQRPM